MIVPEAVTRATIWSVEVAPELSAPMVHTPVAATYDALGVAEIKVSPAGADRAR